MEVPKAISTMKKTHFQYINWNAIISSDTGKQQTFTSFFFCGCVIFTPDLSNIFDPNHAVLVIFCQN